MANCLKAFLLLGLLGACGGDDGSGDGTVPDDIPCGLGVTLEGAIEVHETPSRSAAACGSQHSFRSGIEVVFIFVDEDEPLQHVTLVIDDVLEGEIGTGFPATLTIKHADDRTWMAEHCTAEITEHSYEGPAELDRKSYRVEGNMVCEPAKDPDGNQGDVDVRAVAFAASITWG